MTTAFFREDDCEKVVEFNRVKNGVKRKSKEVKKKVL